MISTCPLVALGGAIGAALRFLSGVAVLRLTGPQDFPLAILTVNVSGSFLMGVFVVAAAHKGLTHLSPFVMTGSAGRVYHVFGVFAGDGHADRAGQIAVRQGFMWPCRWCCRLLG